MKTPDTDLLWSPDPETAARSNISDFIRWLEDTRRGIVVELLKALDLGADLRPDDRYLVITSTSWMVWNFLVAGLLHGATIVLYDGSPAFPDVNVAWRVAQRTGPTMVGVGAGYLVAGEKAGVRPGSDRDPARAVTAPRTGHDRRGPGPPANPHRKEARGSRQADPPGHTTVRGHCGGRCHQPGDADLVRTVRP